MLLAFVHIAKTGGETVETLLRSAHGARHCDARFRSPRGEGGDPFAVRHVIPKYGPEEFRRALRMHPGLRSIGGHPIALWSQLETVRPDVLYFCLVREPLARGASHFQFHRRNDRPCLDWERWREWDVPRDHQAKMLSPHATADDALARIARLRPFIGLTERFDESLVLLRGLFAPRLNIAYVRRNEAPDNTLAKQLLADPARRAELAAMHRQDSLIYEHVANDLYPAWRREYGPTLERDVEEFRRRRAELYDRRRVLANRVWDRGVYAVLDRIVPVPAPSRAPE